MSITDADKLILSMCDERFEEITKMDLTKTDLNGDTLLHYVAKSKSFNDERFDRLKDKNWFIPNKMGIRPFDYLSKSRRRIILNK